MWRGNLCKACEYFCMCVLIVNVMTLKHQIREVYRVSRKEGKNFPKISIISITFWLNWVMVTYKIRLSTHELQPRMICAIEV